MSTIKWSPLIFHAFFQFQFHTCNNMFTGKIVADTVILNFNKNVLNLFLKDIITHPHVVF